MAVINLNKLRCTPVELLYNHVVNKHYGMDCNPLYTEATTYAAYRDYWMYQRKDNCVSNCNIEDIIKKSNYGCDSITICSDKTINCNLTLQIAGDTTNCTGINLIITT